MLARIKKDDLVVVTSGRDRGKQGNVVIIDKDKERVIVKGVGMVTRHIKARQQGETSRIAKEESFLPMCKVMPVCPSCKKPCRITVVQGEGRRVRACHHCKEAF